jgi:hypothetical protein
VVQPHGKFLSYNSCVFHVLHTNALCIQMLCTKVSCVLNSGRIAIDTQLQFCVFPINMFLRSCDPKGTLSQDGRNYYVYERGKQNKVITVVIPTTKNDHLLQEGHGTPR